jgi:hypothetical protein
MQSAAAAGVPARTPQPWRRHGVSGAATWSGGSSSTVASGSSARWRYAHRRQARAASTFPPPPPPHTPPFPPCLLAYRAPGVAVAAGALGRGRCGRGGRRGGLGGGGRAVRLHGPVRHGRATRLAQVRKGRIRRPLLRVRAWRIQRQCCACRHTPRACAARPRPAAHGLVEACGGTATATTAAAAAGKRTGSAAGNGEEGVEIVGAAAAASPALAAFAEHWRARVKAARVGQCMLRIKGLCSSDTCVCTHVRQARRQAGGRATNTHTDRDADAPGRSRAACTSPPCKKSGRFCRHSPYPHVPVSLYTFMHLTCRRPSARRAPP